jgi:hypothetical protein
MVSIPVDGRAARARHPHAIAITPRVQLAAVFVLADEGLKGGAGGDHRGQFPMICKAKPMLNRVRPMIARVDCLLRSACASGFRPPPNPDDTIL